MVVLEVVIARFPVCVLARRSLNPVCTPCPSSLTLMHTRSYSCIHIHSHACSCDVVGLLCLREAAAGGDSLLVSADTLFNEMRRRCVTAGKGGGFHA